MVYHPVLAGLVNLLSSCCQFLGPAFIASPVPDCLSMYKWTGSPPPPGVSVWVRGRGGRVGDVGPGGGRGGWVGDVGAGWGTWGGAEPQLCAGSLGFRG